MTNRRRTAFRPNKVRTPTKRAQSRIKSTRPIAILLIEDHELVRNLIIDILQPEGWHVEVCADGRKALGRIESRKHYDVIVTDNNLPEVSGLELIQHTRMTPHRKHTPIIMISANPYQAEALRAGANAFLSKPDEIGGVVEAVTRLLKIENQYLIDD